MHSCEGRKQGANEKSKMNNTVSNALLLKEKGGE